MEAPFGCDPLDGIDGYADVQVGRVGVVNFSRGDVALDDSRGSGEELLVVEPRKAVARGLRGRRTIRTAW